MPNVTGTLATGVIVQKALDLVFTVRPGLRNVSLDLRDLDTGSVEAKYGQKVTTRTLGIPAVAAFGAAASDAADTDVEVTLNQFKQVGYSFTAAEISGTDRNLIAERALPLAIAIANHMTDAIAGVWTPANFANASIVAGGWGYVNTMLVLQKEMLARGVPMGDWFFTYNADVNAALLADPLIVAEFNNAQNANAISEGKVPQVAGFGAFVYPGLPPADNLVGFAGSRDSTVYAARVPKNPEELLPGAKFPGNVGVITEPNSGLSVMVLEHIGTDLSANVRLVWMYGLGVGNANNGQRLVTA